VKNDDSGLSKALIRYQIISAFLALQPRRGQRQAVLAQLADRTWTGADGQPFQVSAETIRVWVRRYRRDGLGGLEDKARPRRGVTALAPDVVELACQLKAEVPERSLDRLLQILEQMGHVKAGTVRRSTLHRALQRRGMSARKNRVPDSQDLDRFEANAPNDLWQSDMLAGPWLPDPDRPGKVRRAWLYAFLDDHSRLLLHGRFSFKGDLPALELVFRRSLQKYGKCRRVYYDNGATYRSGHMRQIVAELGLHGIIFTQTYRPMGHGKIEAYNRLCTAAFIAEVKASKIRTLDELNEAFLAWIDVEYNQRVHGETGETPMARWRKAVNKVVYADDEHLRRAFLWKETRKPDKSGVFSLFGVEYQVGPELARKSIEVRYDPESLDTVEIWSGERLVQRVRPFEVQAHRRPRIVDENDTARAANADRPPTADWLGHLVRKRRIESFVEPTPQQLADQAHAKRAAADAAVVEAIAARLDAAVVDRAVVGAFLDRYGPFDAPAVGAVLDRIVSRDGRDHHVQRYLDAIRREFGGAV
jgi:putative transposase